MERINRYLNSGEVDPEAVTHNNEGSTVVRITNGNFAWSEEEQPILKNINLDVQRNQLIAIVGQVGCGKSSLLSAILNEMNKCDEGTEVNVNGRISYVPQEGWMQNATLLGQLES